MDKLQELTDKLYKEGLSKGRQEGEAIIKESNEKATAIVEEAQNKAVAIIATANKEAEEIKKKAASDMDMAASQALQSVKKDIESLIVCKITNSEVTKALSSPEFLKEIIKNVASNFSAQESSDLSLILPDSLKGELETFVKKELSSLISKEITADFSKKIAGGFNIGPKDGGWYISLSDETVKSLISEYLRPTTRKVLFGE